MNLTQRIVVDLAQQGQAPFTYAVQGDSGIRVLAVDLRANGLPWEIPSEAELMVRYRKPDGTGGTYDTLPDGTKAWSAQGNVLQVALAPQVCAVPGAVKMMLTFIAASDQITTFPLELRVAGQLPEGRHSEDYTNLASWLEKNGKRGASAYEIDVKNGFKGTVEAWLASLHGKDGLTPHIDDNGNWRLGATDTGYPSCGRDGYTPVRGKDYWTEQDLAALNGYVNKAKTYAENADKKAQEAKTAEDEAKKQAAAAANSASYASEAMACVRYPVRDVVVREEFIPGTSLDYRVDIEATQEGAGEPSPENVRPVAGMDSVNLSVTGKNLYDVTKAYLALQGSSAMERNGGTIRLYSTTDKSYIGLRSNRIFVHAGRKYTYSVDVKELISGDVWFGINYAGTSLVTHSSSAAKTGLIKFTFTANESNFVELRLYGTRSNAIGCDVTFANIQFEIGAAETEYEPYVGEEHTIQLPETCYGGFIDYNRRKYVQTHKMFKLKELSWNVTNEGTIYKASFYVGSGYYPIKYNDTYTFGLCSSMQDKKYIADNSIYVSSVGSIIIRSKRFTNEAELKALLSDDDKFVYELRTPIEYDVPDLPTLTALEGKTTVCSNAADLMVTGYMDAKKYIDKKLAELTALTLEV